MQNSALTKEVHYRFQIYGARMIDHQVNRGDLLYSENVHEVYTILFVNDIDRDNLLLIDTYMPRNQLNHVRKYNLLTHHNVYLPFIDAVVREKGLKNLSKIELAIYTLYHGITDDIMALNSEVVIMMKEKMDQFNEDEELVLAASKRQLFKIQHHQEKVKPTAQVYLQFKIRLKRKVLLESLTVLIFQSPVLWKSSCQMYMNRLTMRIVGTTNSHPVWQVWKLSRTVNLHILIMQRTLRT